MANIRIGLAEWIKEQKRVCPKPIVGQYAVIFDNLYLRYIVPDDEELAGQHRWKRLSSLEVLNKFDSLPKNISPKEWLNSINLSKARRKSIDD